MLDATYTAGRNAAGSSGPVRALILPVIELPLDVGAAERGVRDGGERGGREIDVVFGTIFTPINDFDLEKKLR
jgi:hypothetical protein